MVVDESPYNNSELPFAFLHIDMIMRIVPTRGVPLSC